MLLICVSGEMGTEPAGIPGDQDGKFFGRYKDALEVLRSHPSQGLRTCRLIMSLRKVYCIASGGRLPSPPHRTKSITFTLRFHLAFR